MNLVLLGAPGSGKGTQAERLQAEFKLTHVSSGDLFRDNLGRNTPLGLRAREYMTRGELVPDDLTIDMVKDRLKQPDAGAGVILDGFPRTLPQAEALDRMMAALGRTIDGVIYIEVPDEEIVARLAGRLICRECQLSFHEVVQPLHDVPEPALPRRAPLPARRRPARDGTGASPDLSRTDCPAHRLLPEGRTSPERSGLRHDRGGDGAGARRRENVGLTHV